MTNDVRNTARTAMSVVVVLVVLHLLRILILSYGTLGFHLTRVLWGATVICGASGLYLAVRIAVAFLTKLFAVKWEKSATEETMIYLTIIIGSMFLAYYRFPRLFTAAEELAGGYRLASYTWAYQMERFVPFDYGFLARAPYLALTTMIIIGLILSILDSRLSTGAVLGQLRVPIMLVMLALPMAWVNHSQFTPYRMWLIIYVFAAFGMHRMLGKIVRHYAAAGGGFKLYPAVIGFMRTGFGDSVFDRVIVWLLLVWGLFVQIVVLIALAVFAATRYNELLGRVLEVYV